MRSERSKRLEAACERVFAKQQKATGERYLELDRQWGRLALALYRSRFHDDVPCATWIRGITLNIPKIRRANPQAENES